MVFVRKGRCCRIKAKVSQYRNSKNYHSLVYSRLSTGIIVKVHFYSSSRSESSPLDSNSMDFWRAVFFLTGLRDLLLRRTVTRSVMVSGSSQPAVSGSRRLRRPAARDMTPRTVNWRCGTASPRLTMKGAMMPPPGPPPTPGPCRSCGPWWGRSRRCGCRPRRSWRRGRACRAGPGTG